MTDYPLRDAYREGFDSECSRMHKRLVDDWAKINLWRARGTAATNPEDDRDPTPKIPITPEEQAKADYFERLVNGLQPTPRWALRVFYKGRECEDWWEIDPRKKIEVLDDMCREFNARMLEYCSSNGLPRPIRIRGVYLATLWEQAVRLMVVVEAQQSIPKGLHPCG